MAISTMRQVRCDWEGDRTPKAGDVGDYGGLEPCTREIQYDPDNQTAGEPDPAAGWVVLRGRPAVNVRSADVTEGERHIHPQADRPGEIRTWCPQHARLATRNVPHLAVTPLRRY